VSHIQLAVSSSNSERRLQFDLGLFTPWSLTQLSFWYTLCALPWYGETAALLYSHKLQSASADISLNRLAKKTIFRRIFWPMVSDCTVSFNRVAVNASTSKDIESSSWSCDAVGSPKAIRSAGSELLRNASKTSCAFCVENVNSKYPMHLVVIFVKGREASTTTMSDKGMEYGDRSFFSSRSASLLSSYISDHLRRRLVELALDIDLDEPLVLDEFLLLGLLLSLSDR